MTGKPPPFHDLGVRKWRRNNLWEASQNAARGFAAVNLIVVFANFLAFQEANFEIAFWLGLAVGLGYGIISMLFRTCPVFDK